MVKFNQRDYSEFSAFELDVIYHKRNGIFWILHKTCIENAIHWTILRVVVRQKKTKVATRFFLSLDLLIGKNEILCSSGCDVCDL